MKNQKEQGESEHRCNLFKKKIIKTLVLHGMVRYDMIFLLLLLGLLLVLYTVSSSLYVFQ